MRAPIRGTELYFDINGMELVADGTTMRERPVAFIIHGGPGVDHTGLKSRYGWFARHMQVVYFDHRGHGRSGRGDPATYNLDENVEDMEALRVYLGISQIVSIGASYGGSVAMAHAARYPKSVSHLILIGAAAHGGYAVRAREIVAARGTKEQIEEVENLFEGKIDSLAKMRRYLEVLQSLYACVPVKPEDLKASLDRSILSFEALNQAHAPNGFQRQGDLRAELSKIAAATLITVGRHDWICPPEFSEEIHGLIAGSELAIFEASGHVIGADQPLELEKAVLAFMTRVAS